MSTDKKEPGSSGAKDPLRFQHIKRLVIAAVIGFIVLLTAKFLFVPATYGKYGYYRGAAIDEIRAKKPGHIGRGACVECHQEVEVVTKEFKHHQLSCETCHGPMAAHADEQTDENSRIVFSDRECLRCHQKLAARPKIIRQVEGLTHYSKETCASCHSAHNPRPHPSKKIMRIEGKE